MKTVKYKTIHDLTKKTIETLLKEIFTLHNQNENEQKM